MVPSSQVGAHATGKPLLLGMLGGVIHLDVIICHGESYRILVTLDLRKPLELQMAGTWKFEGFFVSTQQLKFLLESWQAPSDSFELLRMEVWGERMPSLQEYSLLQRILTLSC